MGNLRQSKFKSVFLQNLEATRLGVKKEEPQAKPTAKKTYKKKKVKK